jgi:hypothetical protein
MIARPNNASTPTRGFAALRELVGEVAARIQELIRADSSASVYDEDLVEAIMTDDGGPERGRAPAYECRT